MNRTNYIGAVIKILETPKQKFLKKKILVTKFRAQITQRRTTRIVTLAFWGKLARDIATKYKINDYLLIQGYLSLRNKSPLQNKKSSKSKFSKLKKIEITVTKAYPVFFNLESSN